MRISPILSVQLNHYEIITFNVWWPIVGHYVTKYFNNFLNFMNSVSFTFVPEELSSTSRLCNYFPSLDLDSPKLIRTTGNDMAWTSNHRKETIFTFKQINTMTYVFTNLYDDSLVTNVMTSYLFYPQTSPFTSRHTSVQSLQTSNQRSTTPTTCP